MANTVLIGYVRGTMETTGRVSRGVNPTTGGTNEVLIDVSGFCHLGRCSRCDVLFDRPAAFPGGWTPL